MALTPAEKMKRLRDRRLKDGRCSRCGKRPAPGLTVCKKCNNHAKMAVKESREHD